MDESDQPSPAKKTNKLLYLVVAVFILVLIWFGIVLKGKFLPEKKVHYHAGFIVVENNQLIDFSDTKFMNFRPCSNNQTEEEPQTKEQQQLEKAHLHDNIGDVVHVEAAGAKWKDLFTNIHYTINYQNANAYVNGQKISNFQDHDIKPEESIVIFIGNNNDINTNLSKAVTKAHIDDIAKKSETCGT